MIGIIFLFILGGIALYGMLVVAHLNLFKCFKAGKLEFLHANIYAFSMSFNIRNEFRIRFLPDDSNGIIGI